MQPAMTMRSRRPRAATGAGLRTPPVERSVLSVVLGRGVALFRGGAVVGNHADGPVAFPHRLRSDGEHDEREAVQLHGSVVPALDLVRHCEGARPLRGCHRHLPRHAGTYEIAATRFVIL